MATEKDGSERETITVVMGRELAAMVKTIATHRDITMAEAWERYGRPVILREYRKVLEEMHAVLGEAGA